MMRLKSVDYVAENLGIAPDDVLHWCKLNDVPRFYDGARWVVDFGKAVEVAEKIVQEDDGLVSAVKGHVFESGPKTKIELSRELGCSADQADRAARRLEAAGVLVKRNSYWIWVKTDASSGTMSLVLDYLRKHGPRDSKVLSQVLSTKHMHVLRALGALEREHRVVMTGDGQSLRHWKAVVPPSVEDGWEAAPAVKHSRRPARLPVDRSRKAWEMVEDELILTSTLSHSKLAKIMGRSTSAVSSRRSAYRCGDLTKTW